MQPQDFFRQVIEHQSLSRQIRVALFGGFGYDPVEVIQRIRSLESLKVSDGVLPRLNVRNGVHQSAKYGSVRSAYTIWFHRRGERRFCGRAELHARGRGVALGGMIGHLRAWADDIGEGPVTIDTVVHTRSRLSAESSTSMPVSIHLFCLAATQIAAVPARNLYN